MDWRWPGGPGPLYIGILNCTPDSFSDGGRFEAPGAALDQALRLLDQGAGMLDVGAESTRPGASPVSPDEEWDRLGPVLARLKRELPAAPLSVDTRHAATAARALDAGADVLNDITGFADSAMLRLAAGSGCGFIAMRSRWRDGALWMPPYDDPAPASADPALAELAALRDRLLGAGMAPERLCLDPGFGFGTTFAEDTALWEALPSLPGRLGWPVERLCIGISRKRFTACRAGQPSLPPDRRDGLAAALHEEAEASGYRIFRTHAATRWT